MCGLCGFVLGQSECADRSLIRRMNRSLAHRGPDDQNVHVSENVALGHCRLSIIDLATGAQPMKSAGGRYCIVYNGEVYNYIELRNELEAHGEVFRTNSDTEVILTAYRVWGNEAFRRLNGMFALAIWDDREKELVLARDRFGIKPLYWIARDGHFAFASEIKALRKLPWWDATLDPLAVDQYFSYLVIPEPRTIYRNVHAFPPSHWGRVRNGQLERHAYWDPHFAPQPMSLEEAQEGLDDALRRSVKLCLRSDVPMGAFLSGGLDSSGVVSYATEQATESLQTFSVGFSDEPSYDELPLAKVIASNCGTVHRELDFRFDAEMVPGLARRVIDAHDQPFGDYSAMPQLLIAEFAKKHVKTLLSGDGGDEVLAGYQTCYMPSLVRLYQKLPRFVRQKFVGPCVRSLPTSTDRISLDYVAKRFVRGAEFPMERAHFAWKEVVFAEHKPQLYTEHFWEGLDDHDAFSPMAEAFARSSSYAEVNRLLYVDQRTFLLNDNLPKVDRMSMAVSLEVRLPLLNNSVVDFLLRVPPSLKVKCFRTKYLYRHLLANRLPKSVARAKKRGFTAPVAAWLKKGLYDWAQDTLRCTAFRDLDFVDVDEVGRFLDAHRRSEADHNRLLWSSLMLAVWAEASS